MPLQIPQQVLAKPVTSYYRGKAIRQQQREGELDIQLKQAAVDNIGKTDPKEKRDQEKWAAEQDATARQQGAEWMYAQTDTYASIVQEKGEQAGSDYFLGKLQPIYEAMEPGAEKDALGKMMEDKYISPQEVINARNKSGAILKQFDEADKPTANQQVINDLVARGTISRTDGDKYLTDILAKQGTVTGTTALDPSASPLTDSGINQTTIKFRERVQQAATAAASSIELLDISYESPAAMAKSGSIITFGNEMYVTAKNLIKLAASPALPKSETKQQSQGYDAFDWGDVDKKMSALGVTKANAARWKAGVYSIAFSAAVGEQGSRPSDKDIQAYITIYGGQITDPEAFRATIAQAMRRQYNSLKFTAELNPEIQDSKASLAVFENVYNDFLSALDRGDQRTQGPWDEIEGFSALTPDQKQQFIILYKQKHP